MSVDRRSNPRYPVDLEVRVQPVDVGCDFAADAVMLSRTSVQLTCESDLVMTLVKHNQPPYLCNLRFLLPGENQSLLLSAQVLTHRRVSQQHYVLVFLFKGLDERQESALEDLIGEAVPAHLR